MSVIIIDKSRKYTFLWCFNYIEEIKKVVGGKKTTEKWSHELSPNRVFFIII